MEVVTNVAALKPRASLVQLNNEYAALSARLCELGGELTPETEAELETLIGQLCEKTDAYGIVLRQLENNVAFWKAQAQECRAAQSVYENAIESLKARMRFVLERTEGQSLQGELFRFFLAKAAPKLNIDDNLLPAKYKLSQLVVTADRDAIKRAIDAGETIPGVTVEENKSLRTGRPK